MITILISNLVTIVAAAIGGFFALRAVSRQHTLVLATQAEHESKIAER